MQNNLRRALTALALTTGAALALLIAPVEQGVAAQDGQVSWNGVYTVAQAKRGEALYEKNCLNCHRRDLMGSTGAPPVAGAGLIAHWGHRPLRELLDYTQAQMPMNSPGGLTRQQNADVLAYMLQKSGATAGSKELWFDGPSGAKGQAQRSANYGVVPTPSTKRAEAFFTLEQAERGRAGFNRHCGYCHTVDPKLSTPDDLVKPLPSTFGGHFIERVVNGKVVYPTALALFSKLQSMPGTDTRSITDLQRVDIMAYILQANGLPAGDRELPFNTDAMRLMMVNEPGFERIFNGKDFSGWNVVIGTGCQRGDEGCAKHEVGDNARVENETIICECNRHGYMYTDKKYRNFTLRFETRFERPAYYAPGDDDELFSGGNGYYIHADMEQPSGYPRGLEVEGRHRDLLEFVVGNRPPSLDGATLDLEARRRAIRPLGEWNAIEISSVNGDMKTKLNGVFVTSLKTNAYDRAGHIAFQMQGAKIYWRNIRIRVEAEGGR